MSIIDDSFNTKKPSANPFLIDEKPKGHRGKYFNPAGGFKLVKQNPAYSGSRRSASVAHGGNPHKNVSRSPSVAAHDDSNVHVGCHCFRSYKNPNKNKEKQAILKELHFHVCISNIKNWGDACKCAVHFTSQLTDIDNLFSKFEHLEILNLEGINTSHITSMKGAFYSCKNLKLIKGIEAWDVSNVTNMENMFRECPNLIIPDLSSWDVSKVEFMSSMFKDCSQLVKFPGEKWQTTYLKSTKHMFENSGLVEINLNAWNFSNCSSVEFMFSDCLALKSVDIANKTMININGFDGMFKNCCNLEHCDISFWNISVFSINSRPFPKLNFIPTLKGWNFNCFKSLNKDSLTLLFKGIPRGGTVSNHKFLQKLEHDNALSPVAPVPLSASSSSDDSSNSSDSSSNGNSSNSSDSLNIVPCVEQIDIPQVKNVPQLSSVHNVTFELQEKKPSPKMVSTHNVTFDIPQKKTSPSLSTVVRVESVDIPQKKPANKLHSVVRVESVDIPQKKREMTVSAKVVIADEPKINAKLTPEFRKLRQAHLKSTEYYKQKMSEKDAIISEQAQIIQSFAAKAINNPEKLAATLTLEQFENFDVSKLNHDRLQVFIKAFHDTHEQYVQWNLSKWNMLSHSNLSGLFKDCNSVQVLNLSNWNLTNATNMSGMFYGCSSLETIYVTNWNTSNVRNMSGMFYGCSSLQVIDVSNWIVSNVTNMHSMFSGCQSLQVLDVKLWDVSNVINMKGMFHDCQSIQSLPVRRWNVSKVTNMYGMFHGCSSLQVLDVRRWNVSNVTNMALMFKECQMLTEVKGIENWEEARLRATGFKPIIAESKPRRSIHIDNELLESLRQLSAQDERLVPVLDMILRKTEMRSKPTLKVHTKIEQKPIVNVHPKNQNE